MKEDIWGRDEGLRSRERSRSRSLSPRRSNDEAQAAKEQVADSAAESAPEPTTEELDESQMMAQMMGFTGFGTTAGKKHAEVGAVDKRKQSKFRQYMNRTEGFNKLLTEGAVRPVPGRR